MKRFCILLLTACLMSAVGFFLYALHKQELRGLYNYAREQEAAQLRSAKATQAAYKRKIVVQATASKQPQSPAPQRPSAPQKAPEVKKTLPKPYAPSAKSQQKRPAEYMRSVLDMRNLVFARGPGGEELKESKDISCPRIIGGRIVPDIACRRDYYFGGASSVLIFSGGVLQGRYDYTAKNRLIRRALYFAGDKYGRGADGNLIALDGQVNLIELYDGINNTPQQVITFSAPGVIEDALVNNMLKDTSVSYTFRPDKTLASVLVRSDISKSDSPELTEIIFTDKYHAAQGGDSLQIPPGADTLRGDCRFIYEDGKEKKCSWKLDGAGNTVVDGKAVYLAYSAFPQQPSYCARYKGSCIKKSTAASRYVQKMN